MLYACKGAHTLFSDQREKRRERKREGRVREGREREREKEGGERERKRECERGGGRERKRCRICPILFLFLKGMMGALAPFSYLV